MDIFGVGLPEMMLILVVGLLVFGPRKLPEIGRTLAKGMRSLQDASKEFEAALNREAAELERSTGLKTPKTKSGTSATKTANPAQTTTPQSDDPDQDSDESDEIEQTSEQADSDPVNADVMSDPQAEPGSIAAPELHVDADHEQASDRPLATPMATKSTADLSESPSPQA
ncbi:MAG: TatA/E family twin arginine-targeting protein translocase [Synechococcaceae cyanobacterium SM2_3_1]|nr:TatA/E family twin arginine-targeting protein translocase [Synechococcaceae cyanobacterium SM2_3_1]